jgi:hypothetical protein
MSCWKQAFPFALALLSVSAKSNAADIDTRGVQFIPFTSFRQFVRSPGTNESTFVLTSLELSTRVRWDELIVSWNAQMPSSASLLIEARAIHPDHTTKWFNLGLWSATPEKFRARASKAKATPTAMWTRTQWC